MSGSGSVRGWTAAVLAVAVVTGLVLVSEPDQTGGPVRSDGRPAGRSGLPRPDPDTTDASRERAVAALLQQRGTALRDRDETAFLASLDPKASSDFRQRQHDLFRNLADVPFAQWDYLLHPADTVTPPQPSTLPTPAEATWSPGVTLRYALSGVDEVPTTQPMGYLFVQRGDSWYLADDRGLETQGRRTWRGPWDFDFCRARTTEHGLILGHDGNQILANRVAVALDDAVAAVTEVWGPGWSQQVGVLLPGSHEELQAMVGAEFAVDGIAAVAVADQVDSVARRVEGPRVVLNPKTAGELSDTALRVVLQHEITHVAARADTVDGAPMWLLEGFADYVGYRNSAIPPSEIAPDLARELREEGPPTDFPSDRDFHLAGRRLDLAYQQAWSLIDFLVRRVGEQRVVELYRRLAREGSHASVETVLPELTGMSAPEVVVGWGDELSRTLR